MPQNLAPQMDPIPLPQSSGVQVDPDPRTAPGSGAQMPPVYWGGKTGSSAFLADNVLRGWLAGTKLGREREAKKMSDEVGAAKTGLDYIGQAYRAAVESGDKTKIDETKKALNEAWNDYLDKAQKYAIPDQAVGKDGKPKKEGLGAKLKEGFMGGPKPHIDIGQSTLAILRKTDPTQIYQPSKEDELKRQAQEQSLEKGRQEINLGKQAFEQNEILLQDSKDVRDAKEGYLKSVRNGDKKAQDQYAQTIETLTGKKIDPAYRQELERKVAETATTALDKMNSGSGYETLTDGEQAALVSQGLAVQAKNPMQAYLHEVGPGKRFETQFDAAHQFLVDERTSHVMGMRPTALEDLRASEEVILTHDLQDPKKAEKYGVKPLQPGEPPPRWLVEQEAEHRYRASVEEKSDSKIYNNIAQNRVIGNALKTFSPPEQELIKAMFLSKDDELGTNTLSATPNIGKFDPKKARQLYQAFRNRLYAWSRKMYPGVDTGALDEVFGPTPEGMGYDIAPPPSQNRDIVAPPGSDRSMSAPPQPEKKPDKKQEKASSGNYKVKGPKGYLYGGRAVELSADEVSKLKGHSGYSLEAQ
jgi:hypothetical protein